MLAGHEPVVPVIVIDDVGDSWPTPAAAAAGNWDRLTRSARAASAARG